MKKPKLNEDNAIYAYYQQINNGSICVGEWIRKFYQFVIDGCNQKAFRFDQKKANAAVEWIEKHAFHVEGPLAPGLLKLELWQKALISVVFGIVDDNGLRHFREILLVVARKNGKSLLAAAIAKYTFYVDGGYGARVYTIAPKLDQAEIIYSACWQMIQLDPEWKQLKEDIEASKNEHNKKTADDGGLARHRQSDLFLPANNSTIKKISFDAKNSDGFNPSLAICDEVAAWSGEKGLKVYDVMKSGMGARPEALLFSCTTAGDVDGSIYDELIGRATKFLNGDSKETKFAPFLYMIEDLEKWNDLNELRKSNPNLGVSVPESYYLEEIAVAEMSKPKKVEFMKKYCNIKQNSSMAWFDYEAVSKNFSNVPLQLDDFKGCYAVIGIDLSQTTDLTAVVTIIEKAGKLYGFAKFWMPANKIQEKESFDKVPYSAYVERGLLSLSGENYIEYSDCFDYIMQLLNDYRIYPMQIGYDRYSAQYLVQDLKAAGCKCDDVFQGENLTPVITEVDGLIRDGRFEFGDNDLLRIHLLNSALKVNSQTNRKRLVKIGQTNRIDGMAALLDAMCVRQKWYDEIGYYLRNED